MGSSRWSMRLPVDCGHSLPRPRKLKPRSLICDWLMGLDVLVVKSQVRILPQVGGIDIYE
jgi:hypothetical protein